MEEFRQKVSNFECFTNLDAAESYLQLRISNRSKRYTGFCAFRDLWEYNKTPMGIVPATNFCQAIVEGWCKCHCHLFPYFDDFTTASHGREEMIEKDLPQTLAICSYYNILLSGKKYKDPGRFNQDIGKGSSRGIDRALAGEGRQNSKFGVSWGQKGPSLKTSLYELVHTILQEIEPPLRASERPVQNEKIQARANSPRQLGTSKRSIAGQEEWSDMPIVNQPAPSLPIFHITELVRWSCRNNIQDLQKCLTEAIQRARICT
jgi:hypothetical protein